MWDILRWSFPVFVSIDFFCFSSPTPWFVIIVIGWTVETDSRCPTRFVFYVNILLLIDVPVVWLISSFDWTYSLEKIRGKEFWMPFADIWSQDASLLTKTNVILLFVYSRKPAGGNINISRLIPGPYYLLTSPWEVFSPLIDWWGSRWYDYSFCFYEWESGLDTQILGFGPPTSCWLGGWTWTPWMWSRNEWVKREKTGGGGRRCFRPIFFGR